MEESSSKLTILKTVVTNMTNGELRDYLTSEGFKYYRDDDYNRDIFTKAWGKAEGVPSKMEVFVDYYTVTVRWWYEPHKHASTSGYLDKLDMNAFKVMQDNLIASNKSTQKSFIAWTDGSGNWFHPDKPGGSAYIIIGEDGNEYKRASKGFLHTTHNRMELLAIVSVVNSLPNGAEVVIHSDSQYSINVLSGKWGASENLDIVDRYRSICRAKGIKATLKWVRGHAGNRYNEECDKMARTEYAKMIAPSVEEAPQEEAASPKRKTRRKTKKT